MNNTTNYNLKKPEDTDYFDIEHQNDNMDAIDTQMKANADAASANATAIGTLASLATSVKTSLVAAINEVVGSIGALASLTTSVKTSLVAAINEVVGSIGALASLTTTAKSSIVAAINELVTSIGSKIGTSGVTFENLNANGDVGTGSTQVAKGDHTHNMTNYLAKNNTTEFTPDADYEPATKKYVDDSVGGSSTQRTSVLLATLDGSTAPYTVPTGKKAVITGASVYATLATVNEDTLPFQIGGLTAGARYFYFPATAYRKSSHVGDLFIVLEASNSIYCYASALSGHVVVNIYGYEISSTDDDYDDYVCLAAAYHGYNITTNTNYTVPTGKILILKTMYARCDASGSSITTYCKIGTMYYGFVAATTSGTYLDYHPSECEIGFAAASVVDVRHDEYTMAIFSGKLVDA